MGLRKIGSGRKSSRLGVRQVVQKGIGIDWLERKTYIIDRLVCYTKMDLWKKRI